MKMKKILSCITAAAMAAGACSIPALAENEDGLFEYGSADTENASFENDVMQIDLSESGGPSKKLGNLIPNDVSASVTQSSYNLHDDNRMTPVRNRSTNGDKDKLADVYAIMSCTESSMISKDLADTSIDYSEKHLLWFTYGAGPSDESDPLYGDQGAYYFQGTDAYNRWGVDLDDVIATLGRWSGVQLESIVPETTDYALSEAMRYTSYGHLQNAEYYDPSDKNSIKKSLVNNGAVYGEVNFHNYEVTNGEGYTAYYDPLSYVGVGYSVQAFAIIGWDDNFSKDKFIASGSPSSDGAWLCQNSLGTDWDTDGLFWISYEDPSLKNLCSFQMESPNNYGGIYQYDGCSPMMIDAAPNTYKTAANVFTAVENDTISAVSFHTAEASVPYTIRIYTGVTAEPTTGKCVLTQNGTMTYAGYHTVELSKEISVEKGTRFAVCVSYNKKGAAVYFDGNSNNIPGNTYFMSSDSTTFSEDDYWADYSNSYGVNALIKAFSKSEVPSLDCTAGIGEVTLNWTAISGATKYRLQRCESSTGSWSSIAYPTGTTYTDTSVTNGTEYKYRVIPYIGTTMGITSNVVTATPLASVGTATLSGTAGVGKVSLSWTSVAGATKYRLQRSGGSSTSWSTVAYPTGTTYTDTNVIDKTTYKYRIIAYIGSVSGSASNTVTVTTKESAIGVPTLSGTTENGYVNLTWTSVSGADKYCVQRFDEETAKWGSIGETMYTFFSGTGEISGVTYKYRVCAYVGGAMGSPSNVVTLTPIAEVGAPELSGTAGEGKVTLTWSNIDRASMYRVQRCESGSSSWSTIAYPKPDFPQTEPMTYTDETVTGGKTYKYRVFAYIGKTMGSASNTVTLTPTVKVGKATLSASAGNGKVTLSWTKVTGATKYRLQRCAGSSTSWSTITYPTTTSYTDTSVTNGTAYKYRVLAYVGSTMGDPSNVVTATPTAASSVPVLKAAAGNGKVTLSWTKVTGATKYRLQRCAGSSTSWSTITYPTGTSYTDTSVTNGTTYKYRVLAYVGSAWGSASNTVTATPAASDGTATLSASAGSGKVTLSWTKVTGATKYRLQRCDASGSWSTITYPTGTSYTDTSVKSGTTYKYRILAYVGSSWGSPSNVVTVTVK